MRIAHRRPCAACTAARWAPWRVVDEDRPEQVHEFLGCVLREDVGDVCDFVRGDSVVRLVLESYDVVGRRPPEQLGDLFEVPCGCVPDEGRHPGAKSLRNAASGGPDVDHGSVIYAVHDERGRPVTSRYDVCGASLGSQKLLRAAEVADAELASVDVDEYVRRLDVAAKIADRAR